MVFRLGCTDTTIPWGKKCVCAIRSPPTTNLTYKKSKYLHLMSSYILYSVQYTYTVITTSVAAIEFYGNWMV